MQAGGRGGGRQQGGARTGGRGGAGVGVRLASPQNGGVSKPGRSNFKQVPLSLSHSKTISLVPSAARDLETVTCPWQSVS